MLVAMTEIRRFSRAPADESLDHMRAEGCFGGGANGLALITGRGKLRSVSVASGLS
jgi:hypothetical protein